MSAPLPLVQQQQQLTFQSYIKAIRAALEKGLCIRNFPSQVVERHNKPEVEVQWSKELLLDPVIITRSEQEKCYIEGSINSLRISLKIKQSDEMERVLVDRLARFLEQRAEDFNILRKKHAIDGYDLSFLITSEHVEELRKGKIIDFIIQFIEEVNSEVSALKLSVNSRARVVAQTFLKQFT